LFVHNTCSPRYFRFELLEYAPVARIFLERRDPGGNLQRWLAWLDGEPAMRGIPGECSPAMDVIETKATVEIVMDLPGVAPASVRVVFTDGVLVVAGAKLPARCEDREAEFHLAERSFGRFARAVRLAGALDAGRGTAILAAGELRVVLPRIEERRGRELTITVKGD
jgi:HSP20 family protein